MQPPDRTTVMFITITITLVGRFRALRRRRLIAVLAEEVFQVTLLPPPRGLLPLERSVQRLASCWRARRGVAAGVPDTPPQPTQHIPPLTTMPLSITGSAPQQRRRTPTAGTMPRPLVVGLTRLQGGEGGWGSGEGRQQLLCYSAAAATTPRVNTMTSRRTHTLFHHHHLARLRMWAARGGPARPSAAEGGWVQGPTTPAAAVLGEWEGALRHRNRKRMEETLRMRRRQ